jgi:hypothetical protein
LNVNAWRLLVRTGEKLIFCALKKGGPDDDKTNRSRIFQVKNYHLLFNFSTYHHNESVGHKLQSYP